MKNHADSTKENIYGVIEEVDKVGHICAWGLKNAYIANPVTDTANSIKIHSTFSFVLQKRTL